MLPYDNDNMRSRKRSGSQKRQRQFRIFVACDEDEYAPVNSRAEDAGMSNASYVRACMLGSPGPRSRRKPHVNALELARATAALNKAGSNLNQMAHVLNASRSIALKDCLEALADTREAVAAILELVGRRSRDDRQGHATR
jgi:hypothetical protein